MKRNLYLIIMMGMMLLLISCGKKTNETKQNVSNMENSNVDGQEMINDDLDYIPVDEDAVINALSMLSLGLRMEDRHTHDDGSYCNIEFLYEPNYSSVEFMHYSTSGDEQRPFMRLEMQNTRICVLVHDSDSQSILLESEGMIDNANPDNLKKLAETLMNYESVEHVGIENINNHMYWVENVKYKDNETVEFLVCADSDEHSMVKYGELYLPVVSYKSDREVVLDGSHESTLDEINLTIKENIPEDVLNEWLQWLNN